MKTSILCAAAVVLAAAPAVAQQQVSHTFDFQPGDVVMFHSKGESYPDQTWTITGCEDQGELYKYHCRMRQASGATRDVTMNNYSTNYNVLTLLARGQPTQTAAPKPAAPAAPRQAAAQTTPAPAPGGDQCTATVPNASRAPAFSQAVAKWAIFDTYARRAKEPGMTAPVAVGVTFDSMTVGAAEPNAVLNDPGRGAYLRHSVAPRGAMLYSVRSTYRVCDRYASSVQIRRMEARHVCFKDATGVWGCGIDGFPTTVWLQR